jgi:hypothetical protein
MTLFGGGVHGDRRHLFVQPTPSPATPLGGNLFETDLVYERTVDRALRDSVGDPEPRTEVARRNA